jgi:hypothetical protein
MSLRTLAESDLRTILNDQTNGFGWSIDVTDPSETTQTLSGLSNDVTQAIDPETGQIISSRLVTVSISIQDLIDVGFALPRNISDGSLKPWIVTFNDIVGTSHTFKVKESNPDRALGIVVLILERYQ